MMNTKNKDTFDTENNCLRKGPEDRVWKFVEHEDLMYQTDILKGRSCNFNWLSLTPEGMLTVKGTFHKGYAWDGCTPKFNFLYITWGIFDGQLIKHKNGKYRPYTYYASMVHDVLYQYRRCVPVTRKEADLIFYDMLKATGFRWSWLFYAGVRGFGWVFFGWKYRKFHKKTANEVPLKVS